MTIALEPNDTADPPGFSRNAARIAAERGVPVLDVVVPVYNEQARPGRLACAGCTRYLASSFPFTFRITIADNASTDATAGDRGAAGRRVRPTCGCVHLEQKGRGRALHAVWATPTRRCWPTWTSTCPPTWPRCCRWSRR